MSADRLGGSTRSDSPIHVPGEALALSSVNAPTLTAVTSSLCNAHLCDSTGGGVESDLLVPPFISSEGI